MSEIIVTTEQRLRAIMEEVRDAGQPQKRHPLDQIQHVRQMSDALGVRLMHVYRVSEAAPMLSLSPRAVRGLPQARLPRTHLVGDTYGYLGVHLLCFIAALPPVDVRGMVQDLVEVAATRPRVVPITEAPPLPVPNGGPPHQAPPRQVRRPASDTSASALRKIA